jgi:hypothetical protein
MICEWCGKRQATDSHHCIFGRNKNKPEFDDPHNIGDVCRECHSQWIGTGGREVREAWWRIKCVKYGEKNMRDWYESVPTKSVKERYD